VFSLPTYAFGTEMVEKLQAASPCTADWEQMIGDERVRWCPQCNLNVYNLSAMSKREVTQLVREREGLRLCGRLYRRADGTVITRNCQGGTKSVARRASRLVAASLAAAIGTGIGTAQTPEPTARVQIGEAQTGIDIKILDLNGRPIQGASVSIRSGILNDPISGTTNKKGEWQFRGLEPARYQLFLFAPGLSPSTHIVTVVDHSVSRLEVQLQEAFVMGEVVTIQRHRNP
jgi:carboxypeptidase family protein